MKSEGNNNNNSNNNNNNNNTNNNNNCKSVGGNTTPKDIKPGSPSVSTTPNSSVSSHQSNGDTKPLNGK